MDFEEYRQPWETGPHWELKREFLESYRDTFPEDRLLCLAQAYSNIVLLHCSYPAEVMIQVHELSKSLKGCKKFRGDQNSSQNSNTSPQKRKGKRSSDSGEAKKFKFIKFCSGEKKLLSGENPSDNSSTVNLNDGDSCPVEFCSEEKKLLSDENSSDNSSTANNFSIKIDSCPIVSLNIDYASLSQSKDFETINLLATQVQKFVMVKKKNAMDIIQSSAALLKINDLIQFKFTNITKEKSNAKTEKNLCEFFVGSTRIAATEGSSAENAKRKAADHALQLLMNFENMPTQNLNALQNTNSNINSKQTETNLFLLKFAEHLKSNLKKNQNPVSVINETGIQMKISDSLVFYFSLDLTSPNHSCNFICNFSVKSISISQGKATSKKKAKHEAAECGIKFLLNLLEPKKDSALHSNNTTENNKTVDKMLSSKKENFNISKLKQEKLNPKSPISIKDSSDSLATKCISKEDSSTTSNSKELSLEEKKSDPNLTKPLFKESSAKTHPLTLNQRLLSNTFRQKLVLIDKSEIEETQTYSSIMSQSSQLCRKNLTYEVDQINDGEFKANLLLDKEVVASGTGATVKLARIDAAKSAVEILRKKVYTLKVKNDLEESLIINRVQMANFDTDNSRAISEGNVGHKMLKMMGWSGGGIGKCEGRLEPVMLEDTTPGRGLGFKEKKQVGGNMTRKQFLQKIETLLKDFSQSNFMNVLIFSPDFLKSEREIIHKVAIKFNLCHTSYGKEARQLCVRRKYSITELLDFILQSGGRTEKYELVDMST